MIGQQQVFNEIEKALSEKFLSPIHIEKINSIGGGCINHASKIETNAGEFFVKWNSNCAHDIFLREAESLTALKKAANDQLIIPEVFAAKKLDETPGFLVLEFLPTRGSTQMDEEKLGRGLAQIHKYTNEQFGFHHNNYCGSTIQNNVWVDNWISFYREKRLSHIIGLIRETQFLSSAELDIYNALLNKLEFLIPEHSVPSLIHGDLWSGNYMITENGPSLIDPASYYANREMEFGIITMFGGFSSHFYKAYNEVFPLEDDWMERNNLYQLYHILNHYYLFGGAYGQQALRVASSYL